MTFIAWTSQAVEWVADANRFPSRKARNLAGAMFCLRRALSAANRTKSTNDPARSILRMMNWVRAEMKRAAL